MTLTDDYQRIAERSLDASRHLSGVGVQESVAFYAYHAFESIGAALILSFNRNIPRRHQAKLNQFVAAAGRRPYGHTVAQLAIQPQNLRNQCLYPVVHPGGAVQRPEDALTLAQARRLLQRVVGIIRRVQRDL